MDAVHSGHRGPPVAGAARDRGERRAAVFACLDCRLFAFYSFAVSKRSVYLLALYPAVALLVGWWADVVSREPGTQAWLGRIVAVFYWVLLGVVALLALLVAIQGVGITAPPRYGRESAAAGGAGVCRMDRQYSRTRVWVLLATCVSIGGALYAGARAARAARWPNVFAALLATMAISPSFRFSR